MKEYIMVLILTCPPPNIDAPKVEFTVFATQAACEKTRDFINSNGTHLMGAICVEDTLNKLKGVNYE